MSTTNTYLGIVETAQALELQYIPQITLQATTQVIHVSVVGQHGGIGANKHGQKHNTTVDTTHTAPE